MSKKNSVVFGYLRRFDINPTDIAKMVIDFLGNGDCFIKLNDIQFNETQMFLFNPKMVGLCKSNPNCSITFKLMQSKCKSKLYSGNAHFFQCGLISIAKTSNCSVNVGNDENDFEFDKLASMTEDCSFDTLFIKLSKNPSDNYSNVINKALMTEIDSWLAGDDSDSENARSPAISRTNSEDDIVSGSSSNEMGSNELNAMFSNGGNSTNLLNGRNAQQQIVRLDTIETYYLDCGHYIDNKQYACYIGENEDRWKLQLFDSSLTSNMKQNNNNNYLSNVSSNISNTTANSSSIDTNRLSAANSQTESLVSLGSHLSNISNVSSNVSSPGFETLSLYDAISKSNSSSNIMANFGEELFLKRKDCVQLRVENGYLFWTKNDKILLNNKNKEKNIEMDNNNKDITLQEMDENDTQETEKSCQRIKNGKIKLDLDKFNYYAAVAVCGCPCKRAMNRFEFVVSF